ncbi:AAA family ATPase [Sphingomonas sp. NIBR02145]|uniref:ATP-dependent nuclease n=1 Tax=Sphingomonas sp. NIBR02145 TaxID=3014784 RepID=UPI0022B3F19B|nr:AAA family ATPase [Sphingomonas sp. NIBR02145]WHU05022.1 AAA family ATPase [Sphingomonas sp. NIBR02145]
MPRIPADSDIPIYLSLSRAGAQQRAIEGRALVIVPDDRGFNDFGAIYRADLHLVGVMDTGAPLRMRLMIEGHPRTRSYLIDQLGLTDMHGNRPRRRLDRIQSPFVSVLQSESDYRRLVSLLGFDDAIGCLRRMHDAVLARLENEAGDAATLQLTRTIDFHQGALRDEGTWAAFRQGDRYLTPNRPPDVDEAAGSFTVKADLRGMVGEHVLDADFGEDFPLARRTLVLVGRNGTGKTRLFEAMIDGLRIAPPWEAEFDIDRAATFNPRPDFSRLIVFSSVASDPYPQSLPPWEGIDYRYHRMIGARGGEGGGLTMALVDCLRADTDIQGFGRSGAMELLNTVLEPLGISDSLYVELSEATEPDTLPPPTRINGRDYFPLLRRMNEQRNLQLYARINTDRPPIVMAGHARPRHLSSGEVALMRFAAYAVASLRRGTIFLFDEPETHLHPNYISQFMEMLDELLEQSGSIALIATHSAYVVREVPARRVRMITRDPDDDTIMIDPPTMQTFGASVDTISQFVFSDIGPKHRFQHLLEQYVEDNPEATLPQIRRRFAEDLNPETLSYLAELVGRREAL